jgi:outer membrane lipoprotein-sorting protein
MRRLRTASTRRLVTIAAVLVAVAAGAGIAQAALNSAPKPDPKPLDRAVHDALNAPAVEGVTARIEFTNHLLPSGSLPENTASPILTGATGRLWLAGDGRLRLELQSSNGDAQIVADGERFMVYDAASKNAYVGRLPQSDEKPRATGRPSLDAVRRGLAQLGQAWTLSGATPSSTAGQPTYTVRVAPKDDGGLLGALEMAWDAVRGVPLRAAIYAQGSDDPVLEVEATDVSYGRIAASAIDTTPPAGAKVTEIDPPAGVDANGKPTHVEGVDEVAKRLAFPLAAPDELAGLPRRSVRLIRMGSESGAVSLYGRGLGAILVFQTKAGEAKPPGRDGMTLPQVNIDGATGTELATALGTMLTFERDGVRYTVVGSVPPVAAENAARGLK